MKNQTKFIGLLFMALLIGMLSCNKDELVLNEEQEMIAGGLPEAIPITDILEYVLDYGDKLPTDVHSDVAEIAALHMKLSSTRATRMHNAADDPDRIDNEGTIPTTQQWRHGYVILSGIRIYGEAHNNCKNNIQNNGYNNKDAFDFYPSDKVNGDYYVGYASHYIQDLANPWHTSANIVQQLTTHEGYEKWIAANWTAGQNFKQYVDADKNYYAVTDPASSAITLAKYSNGLYSTVYDAYVNSGKPTGANGGNADLNYYTRILLRASCRYTKGLIKYTLDHESAW